VIIRTKWGELEFSIRSREEAVKREYLLHGRAKAVLLARNLYRCKLKEAADMVFGLEEKLGRRK
jgi:hypothetical protein